MLRVRDIMTVGVVTLSPDATLEGAQRDPVVARSLGPVDTVELPAAGERVARHLRGVAGERGRGGSPR